jgi:hypothetical protein
MDAHVFYNRWLHQGQLHFISFSFILIFNLIKLQLTHRIQSIGKKLMIIQKMYIFTHFKIQKMFHQKSA